MGRATDYQKLLGECISFHGHLCMGQVLGVRIAVKGLELAGPSTPLTPVLFDFGVSALAGTVVVDETKVWRHVAEGGERSVFANGARMVKCEPGMMHAHQD